MGNFFGIEVAILKGVILAGGRGTRLHPLTLVTSKQLLPVFDKPMIYYPLSTLIHAGCDEILVISNPEDRDRFSKLLGDGSQFGIRICYKIQSSPAGIAHAMIGIESFLENQSFWFILGDNFFHGPTFGTSLRDIELTNGSVCFLYHVGDPSQYGVAVLDDSKQIMQIIEKPQTPISNFAIPGLYGFPANAPDIASKLKPSDRGEIEITDLLDQYRTNQELIGIRVSRGNTWLDLGTAGNILEAGRFVELLQKNQGLLIGSPEEAAFHAGYLSNSRISEINSQPSTNSYIKLLQEIFNEI
jgi:glucose-1-phosphate thymidylyltransferase